MTDITKFLEFDDLFYLSKVSKTSRNPNLDKRRNCEIAASFQSLENWSFWICFGFRILGFEFGRRVDLRRCLARS